MGEVSRHATVPHRLARPTGSTARSRRQDAFQGKGVPLYQVQIDPQAQRAITFQIRDAMNDFLRQLHDVDATMPGTCQELERQLGVRIVVCDRQDPEEVGFVQWRPAFYVAGVDQPMSPMSRGVEWGCDTLLL